MQVNVSNTIHAAHPVLLRRTPAAFALSFMTTFSLSHHRIAMRPTIRIAAIRLAAVLRLGPQANTQRKRRPNRKLETPTGPTAKGPARADSPGAAAGR